MRVSMPLSKKQTGQRGGRSRLSLLAPGSSHPVVSPDTPLPLRVAKTYRFEL